MFNCMSTFQPPHISFWRQLYAGWAMDHTSSLDAVIYEFIHQGQCFRMDMRRDSDRKDGMNPNMASEMVSISVTVIHQGGSGRCGFTNSRCYVCVAPQNWRTCRIPSCHHSINRIPNLQLLRRALHILDALMLLLMFHSLLVGFHTPSNDGEPLFAIKPGYLRFHSSEMRSADVWGHEMARSPSSLRNSIQCSACPV